MLKRFFSYRQRLVFVEFIVAVVLLLGLLLDRAGAEAGVGRSNGSGMALAAAGATPTAQGFVGPTPTVPSFERPNLHIYLVDGQNETTARFVPPEKYLRGIFFFSFGSYSTLIKLHTPFL